MTQSQREKLAARYSEKAKAGLVDVKFYVRNTEEATYENVCAEANRLLDAMERGDCEPLDFADRDA